ncbi:proteic killer suppression protein [Saccharothrix variisporea]|uniref:Proteic killer suppression protein n=2 Tax=Saccharothrix variisporea TaxID=543527 RepID=A0A495XPL8_9PSEU|nr:proteic killer suppression protein [Saccharothrix variisporea]
MEVGFASLRMAKTCSSPAQTRRQWGSEGARKIRLRLDQMIAASSLAELVSLPQVRWGPLVTGADERFVLDLGGGRQMVVFVDDAPAPRRADGTIDLERVERLLVVEITEPG